MRLFIAINFSDVTVKRLLALRDELLVRSVSGNFSLPENLHLTLAFLGECDEKQAEAAKTTINLITSEPIDLTIDCVGRFRREKGDVWWAGVRADKTLLTIQNSITKKLIHSGLNFENRRYSPHITLGREVITDSEPWRIEEFSETIHSIDLMKSERINGKLTYTAIHGKRL